jgi:hypothetical protein
MPNLGDTKFLRVMTSWSQEFASACVVKGKAFCILWQLECFQPCCHLSTPQMAMSHAVLLPPPPHPRLIFQFLNSLVFMVWGC